MTKQRNSLLGLGRGAPIVDADSKIPNVVRAFLAMFFFNSFIEKGKSLLPDEYFNKGGNLPPNVNAKRQEIGVALNKCAGAETFQDERHHSFIKRFTNDNLILNFPDIRNLQASTTCPNLLILVQAYFKEMSPYIDELKDLLIKKGSSPLTNQEISVQAIETTALYIYALINLSEIKNTLNKHQALTVKDFSDDTLNDLIQLLSIPNDDENRSEWKPTIRLVQFFCEKDKKSVTMNSLPRNLIFEGAPGTGKSSTIQKFTGDSDRIFRTTFHEDYSHADFIGRVRPVPETGSNIISFKWQPGPFIDAYISAIKYPEKPTFLIVEELSRGRPAQIFGNLFALLDRDSTGISKYPESVADTALRAYLKEQLSEDNSSSLKLPLNLYIWATMNTQDQTTSNIDSAFLRRWQTRSLYVELEKISGEIFLPQCGKWVTLREIITVINEKIINDDDFINRLEMGQYYIRLEGIDHDGESEEIEERKRELVFSRILGHLRSIGASESTIYDIFQEIFGKYDESNKIFEKNDSKKLIKNLHFCFVKNAV